MGDQSVIVREQRPKRRGLQVWACQANDLSARRLAPLLVPTCRAKPVHLQPPTFLALFLFQGKFSLTLRPNRKRFTLLQFQSTLIPDTVGSVAHHSKLVCLLPFTPDLHRSRHYASLGAHPALPSPEFFTSPHLSLSFASML